MRNWTYNYSAFVGPKHALDDIQAAITPEGKFDFERINPTPEVFDAYGAPVDVIDDDAFAKEYGLKEAPTTIEDFTAFAKDFTFVSEAYNNGEKRKLQDMPKSVHRLIKDAYGYNDWYDWRSGNWESKWIGTSAEATRYHENLLIVTFETAWTTPKGIFATLRDTYNNLHIINGVDIEGFGDPIEASEGGLTSFLTYFITRSNVEIDVYQDLEEESEKDITLWSSQGCLVDEGNIDMLIGNGVLVGEDQAIIKIDSFNNAGGPNNTDNANNTDTQ